jgi:hypothetical protein
VGQQHLRPLRVRSHLRRVGCNSDHVHILGGGPKTRTDLTWKPCCTVGCINYKTNLDVCGCPYVALCTEQQHGLEKRRSCYGDCPKGGGRPSSTSTNLKVVSAHAVSLLCCAPCFIIQACCLGRVVARTTVPLVRVVFVAVLVATTREEVKGSITLLNFGTQKHEQTFDYLINFYMDINARRQII